MEQIISDKLKDNGQYIESRREALNRLKPDNRIKEGKGEENK